MDVKAVTKTIARQIVDRCNAGHLKGKKRDNLALEMWTGAMMAAHAIAGRDEDPLFQYLACLGVFLISTRGYCEIEKLAKGE